MSEGQKERRRRRWKKLPYMAMYYVNYAMDLLDQGEEQWGPELERALNDHNIPAARVAGANLRRVMTAASGKLKLVPGEARRALGIQKHEGEEGET